MAWQMIVSKQYLKELIILIITIIMTIIIAIIIIPVIIIPVPLKFWVDVRWGIVVSHGSEGLLSLGWQLS